MRRGQTLVLLLVFMTVAITVTAAAVAVTVSSSRSASDLEISTAAYLAAESGAEEGLIRLLRNPGYTDGTLTVSDGTATITVAGGVITSTGQNGNAARTVQVTTVRSAGILSVTDWMEIYP